ncbi:hypothetical protein [Butyrivibrio sp. JL13D10]
MNLCKVENGNRTEHCEGELGMCLAWRKETVMVLLSKPMVEELKHILER